VGFEQNWDKADAQEAKASAAVTSIAPAAETAAIDVPAITAAPVKLEPVADAQEGEKTERAMPTGDEGKRDAATQPKSSDCQPAIQPPRLSRAKRRAAWKAQRQENRQMAGANK